MIKIYFDQDTKAEIEKLYLKDAHSAKTGIFQVLNNPDVEKLLAEDRYQKIHNELYDASTHSLLEQNVEKLLLADREAIKSYIDKFGSFHGKDSDDLLDNVFRYDRYANRVCADKILRKMDVTVCPYCNRQFISTIASGKVRPQMDHFYPKSQYPYLALSLYNMIPSCGVCNLSKLSLDTVKTPIVYPFDEEFGYDARFEILINKTGNFVKIMQGVSDEFQIELDTAQAKNATQITTQMEQLHLDELYNEHKDYVAAILKSKYVNTPKRISEVRRMFPDLFRSDDEVKNMLYMTDLRKELWGKRPLSKLTHDIDGQIEREDVRYAE